MGDDKPIKISIDRDEIFADRPSGMRHSLYLDPEAREVSTFSVVGSGQPIAAFHGRALMISIPVGVRGSDLADWLEGERDAIGEIFADYLGSEWNGNNHVGRWRVPGDYCDMPDHVDAVCKLELSLGEAELPTLWPAGDYLAAGDYTDRELELLTTPEGREELAEELIAGADHSVVLDRDDLIEYLTDYHARISDDEN